jgi:hypothetical protein
MRSAVRVDRRESGDTRLRDAPPQYDRVVHLGVILPNFGEESTAEQIRTTAQAAEELGFDSVWATEHIIVGPEAVDAYGRVYDPLVVLAWIAGFTGRVGLGTSVVLAPLHHPIRLAKEVATLQEISNERVRLGVGVGWHEDEFRFMGYEYGERGRRTDEAIRLMKALWAGERSFRGDYWSFEDATFSPLPKIAPVNSETSGTRPNRSGPRHSRGSRCATPTSAWFRGFRSTRSRCSLPRARTVSSPISSARARLRRLLAASVDSSLAANSFCLPEERSDAAVGPGRWPPTRGGRRESDNSSVAVASFAAGRRSAPQRLCIVELRGSYSRDGRVAAHSRGGSLGK